MPRVQTIQKRYLILCEGIDVFNFLLFYLESPALQDDPRYSNDIQLFNFSGISDLCSYINNLQKMDRYSEVNRLVILRDAEKDVQDAINSIKNSLARNSLPVPENCNQWKSSEDGSIQVAFTLLPTCNNTPTAGTLEDLCWDILKQENADNMKDDVQCFVHNIVEKYNSIGSHEHKSRIHTFFSVNKDYISFKIGEAAKAGAFNWEHEKLNGLKELLSTGF